MRSRSAFTLIDSRPRGRCPSVFVAPASRGDKRIQGFTLIELLVVIAILSVLAIVVVLTLNPAGLLAESRDANRVSDMGTLNTAIGLYAADGGTSLGSSSVIYVSIPDTTATSSLGDQCQGLGLPSLPLGYTYQCAASSTYRSTNGTGWIPVNLSNTTFGTPLSELPIDPTNTSSSRRYYTYTTNGSQFEVTSPMESGKYKLGGSGDVIATDGGTLATVYEKGSKLGLEPLDYGDAALVGYWTFDENTSSVAYDYSGSGVTGNPSGTIVPTPTTGKINGAFNINGGNGTSSGMKFGTSTILSFGNGTTDSPLTFSAWINFINCSIWDPLIVKSDFSTNAREYLFYMHNQDCKIDVILMTTGSFTNRIGRFYSSALSTGTWYHLVATYDGSKLESGLKIYVNGVRVDDSSDSAGSYAGMSHTATPLSIGNDWNNYPTPGNSLNGFIDDVRIYNRALSAAEVAALYNGGK